MLLVYASMGKGKASTRTWFQTRLCFYTTNSKPVWIIILIYLSAHLILLIYASCIEFAPPSAVIKSIGQ